MRRRIFRRSALDQSLGVTLAQLLLRRSAWVVGEGSLVLAKRPERAIREIVSDGQRPEERRGPAMTYTQMGA